MRIFIFRPAMVSSATCKETNHLFVPSNPALTGWPGSALRVFPIDFRLLGEPRTAPHRHKGPADRRALDCGRMTDSGLTPSSSAIFPSEPPSGTARGAERSGSCALSPSSLTTSSIYIDADTKNRTQRNGFRPTESTAYLTIPSSWDADRPPPHLEYHVHLEEDRRFAAKIDAHVTEPFPSPLLSRQSPTPLLALLADLDLLRKLPLVPVCSEIEDPSPAAETPAEDRRSVGGAVQRLTYTPGSLKALIHFP